MAWLAWAWRVNGTLNLTRVISLPATWPLASRRHNETTVLE
jgi:hypothetical protein